MTSRRLAAIAALLVLPACALNQGGSSADGAHDGLRTVSASPTPQPSLQGARKASKVTIRVLPQIAQPGRKTSKASAARVPVTVQVAPKRRTAVTLQAKAGSGWKRVARATTDKKGRHVFAAPARRGGKAATYRVTVGKRASQPASTQRWLSSKFTDDFTGGSLSSSWSHRRQHTEQVGRRCSRGDKRAVKVTKGTVRLSVLKDPDNRSKCAGVLNGKKTGMFARRLNGHISTDGKVSFRYGFAAARLKFPRKQGQHGGFWLMPQVHESGTVDPRRTGAEIDVVESFGEKAGPKSSMGLASFTYHWVLKNGGGELTETGGYLKNVRPLLQDKKDSWSKRYHVFSVEWTPSAYIFRIDGKESWRSTRGVSGQPQYAILSLLSSDYELARLEGGDKKLPQHMHVDWVRIWETGS